MPEENVANSTSPVRSSRRRYVAVELVDVALMEAYSALDDAELAVTRAKRRIRAMARAARWRDQSAVA